MRLTCPNCSSQFNLSEDVLGEKGRKVKCSTCKEIWFQKIPAQVTNSEASELISAIRDLKNDAENIVPETEQEQSSGASQTFSQLLNDLENKVDTMLVSQENLPNSVKPDLVEIIRRSGIKKYTSPVKAEGRIGAILATVFIFAISFIILLSMSTSITRAYPAANSLFSIFGVEMKISGEGLVFDKMVAQMNSNNEVNLSGHIINLGKGTQIIPMIEASLNSVDGQSITKWYITPPKNLISAEENLAFGSKISLAHINSFNNLNEKKLKDILLRFVLLPKTGEEAGDNTQVLPADAEIHLSAHEEDAKSPQHVSSEPHPESSHSQSH